MATLILAMQALLACQFGRMWPVPRSEILGLLHHNPEVAASDRNSARAAVQPEDQILRCRVCGSDQDPAVVM